MQDEQATPTGEDLEQGAGVVQDETTLPESPSVDETAVDEVDDSVSDEENESSEDVETDSTETKEDKTLLKYAKSQGFDTENITPETLKALKIARDNQKTFRSSGKEVAKDIEQLYQGDDNDIRAELNAIKAKQATQDFFTEQPEAKKFESAMCQVLKNEEKQYGKEAAIILSRNLPRLLREAKAIAGEDGTKEAVEKAKRTERERLNKQTQGASDRMDATNTAKKGNTKVTREWFANEYDPSNAEHRALVDKAFANGQL